MPFENTIKRQVFPQAPSPGRNQHALRELESEFTTLCGREGIGIDTGISDHPV
jgi:hypothetical protein